MCMRAAQCLSKTKQVRQNPQAGVVRGTCRKISSNQITNVHEPTMFELVAKPEPVNRSSWGEG